MDLTGVFDIEILIRIYLTFLATKKKKKKCLYYVLGFYDNTCCDLLIKYTIFFIYNKFRS